MIGLASADANVRPLAPLIVLKQELENSRRFAWLMDWLYADVGLMDVAKGAIAEGNNWVNVNLSSD